VEVRFRNPDLAFACLSADGPCLVLGSAANSTPARNITIETTRPPNAEMSNEPEVTIVERDESGNVVATYGHPIPRADCVSVPGSGRRG
jgi:hypothetical protein